MFTLDQIFGKKSNQKESFAEGCLFDMIKLIIIFSILMGIVIGIISEL